MSSTTLWRVFKTAVSEEERFRNSWGSAPPLWDMLGYRYLGLDQSACIAGDAIMSQVCKLARAEHVPEHLRITLACTFDHAVIPAGAAEKAAAAFEATHADLLAEPTRQTRYGGPTPPPSWSHWPAIAAALRKAKRDARMFGWGIGCTSVSDPWEWYSSKPKPDAVFDAVSYAVGHQQGTEPEIGQNAQTYLAWPPP